MEKCGCYVFVKKVDLLKLKEVPLRFEKGNVVV